MIYLRKFENYAAYEAAKSSLILPNVSLTVDNNTVHYNPSSPTPPTPSVSITSIELNGEQVETPFCDYGGNVELYFSEPISFNELLNVVIEAGVCDYGETKIYRASIVESGEGDIIIRWGDDDGSLYFYRYSFEGTVDHIDIGHNDYEAYYNRIYIE